MNYALQMTVTVPEKMSAQVVCVREAAETYQEAARSLLDVDGIVELRRNGGEP
jgi:muconolactone delta-isomerase